MSGVATRCDKAQATFTIAAVIELSSEDKAAVPVQAGFSQLSRGTHKVRCALPGHPIVASIRNLPGDAGACMGAGYVSIDSLVVDDHDTIAHPIAFNWQCPGEKILTRLVVATTPAGSTLTTCTAKDWQWGVGFSGIECTTKNLARRSKAESATGAQ